MQIKQTTLFWGIISVFLLFSIYLVNDILTPFVFGLVVAYFLDPFADKIEDLGVSRNIATVIVISIFALLGSMVLFFLGPIFLDQFNKLMVNIPVFIANIEEAHGAKIHDLLAEYAPEVKDKVKDFAYNFSVQVVEITSQVLKKLVTSGSAAINFLSLVVVSPIVAFYLVRDWDEIVKKLDELLPRKNLSGLRNEFSKIDAIISSYIRGQVSVAFIMSIFYSIGLSMVGLNYGFAIGILTGVLSFIPYVGMAIGMITGLAVAYFQFGLDDGLVIVFLTFLTGNVLEGNFITPKLVGEKVQLHPAWVIFALLAGGALLGFTGVLIAIPVAAVMGVIIRTLISKYKKSSIYLGYPVMALNAPDRSDSSVVDEKPKPSTSQKASTKNTKASDSVVQKDTSKQPVKKRKRGRPRKIEN